MKNEEIVKALRATESSSKRELLDAAADLIEKLTDRCARYAEEIAVAQERTRWVPVGERLPEVSNSWGVSDIVLCIISDPSGYPPPNPGLCIFGGRKMDVPRADCAGHALDAAAGTAKGGKVNEKTDN